jgi:hypothetical protein
MKLTPSCHLHFCPREDRGEVIAGVVEIRAVVDLGHETELDPEFGHRAWAQVATRIRPIQLGGGLAACTPLCELAGALGPCRGELQMNRTPLAHTARLLGIYALCGAVAAGAGLPRASAQGAAEPPLDLCSQRCAERAALCSADCAEGDERCSEDCKLEDYDCQQECRSDEEPDESAEGSADEPEEAGEEAEEPATPDPDAEEEAEDSTDGEPQEDSGPRKEPARKPGQPAQSQPRQR